MQKRTRVKFCGITRYEDAVQAIELGVDALGFVFYGPSPRNIGVEQAAAIVEKLPPLVCKVGLFVDAGATEVNEVLASVSIDVVQFHGNESPVECEQVDRPYIKAVRMAPDVDLSVQAARYDSATALLLDAFEPGAVGGTGSAFEWTRVPASLVKPVILAGGLGADNVAAAIRAVEPYAVDVSSGIERSRGIKDAVKMKEFMLEVNSVER